MIVHCDLFQAILILRGSLGAYPQRGELWSQCYKILIYPRSTVTLSFCVSKQYYEGNYRGMSESNTMVIYRGISTLEITGIFITLALNYRGI